MRLHEPDGVATIRPYRDGDRPFIEALFDEFQDILVALDPLKRIRRQPGYGKSYTERTMRTVAAVDGTFLIAEDRDGIVGFVVGIVHRSTPEQELEGVPSTTGRVMELYVRDGVRSRGMGTTLMAQIEERFREQGCDVVRVEVFAPNEDARRFYGRLGYEPREIDQIKLLKPGQGRPVCASLSRRCSCT